MFDLLYVDNNNGINNLNNFNNINISKNSSFMNLNNIQLNNLSNLKTINANENITGKKKVYIKEKDKYFHIPGDFKNIYFYLI